MQRINKKKNVGFTLIEVMVVIVILAILAALVVPKIISRPDQAKAVKAKHDVEVIEATMDLYKLDNGYYPSEEQGIEALVRRPLTAPQPSNWQSGGYLKSLPKDPWGHAYHYKNPGQHEEIDIFTWGANNAPEGTGHDAVIGNWYVEKTPS